MQAAVAEARLAAAVAAAEQVTDSMVHRMLVELETGGNIRSLPSPISMHCLCLHVDNVLACSLCLMLWAVLMQVCSGNK